MWEHTCNTAEESQAKAGPRSEATYSGACWERWPEQEAGKGLHLVYYFFKAHCYGVKVPASQASICDVSWKVTETLMTASHSTRAARIMRTKGGGHANVKRRMHSADSAMQCQVPPLR